jgi:hypothetical protein
MTTPTTALTGAAARTPRSWPILLLALPAFVAIWSGWVGLGELTGFGPVQLLPGIWDAAQINSAITLPIGMETYAAYALHVMLTGHASARARTFARWSAAGSLALGAGGQVAYHLMTAAGVTTAPPAITAVVACLPVAVLGMGAALAHLVRDQPPGPETTAEDTGTHTIPDPESSVAETVPGPQARPARTTRSPAKTAATRPARGGTAVRVARLRAAHPDMPTAEIARRLGVTDRTVRRHLTATEATPGPDAAPVAA